MAERKIDKIMTKAKDTLSSNDRMKKLLAAGKDKLDEISHSSEDKQSFVYQLQLLLRMVRAQFTGEYRGFSVQTMVMLVFAIVYFITPFDLLPDFIPVLGFTDDISIVLMVFRTLKKDIDEFELWEEGETD